MSNVVKKTSVMTDLLKNCHLSITVPFVHIPPLLSVNPRLQNNTVQLYMNT